MDIAKAPDMSKFLNRLGAVLVFAALAVNSLAAWKMYRSLPAEGAGGFKVHAWAYGKFTEAIGVREPAPVLAVKALGLTGLPPALSAKVLGLAAFAALVILTFLALKRRFGFEAGAIGALFLAANPYFTFYAMRGPTDLFPILFFLAFLEAADRGGLSSRGLVLTALFGALAALSKIIFLPFVLYALAAAALKDRSAQRLKFTLRALLLCFALVSPYFIWQAAAYSGPLSLQKNTLRHWRNIELRGPVLEVPYEGGPLGPAGFVFAGGPVRAAARFGAGLKKIFLTALPRVAYYYRIELFFGLTGLVLLFMNGEWAFASLFFVFLLPLASIAAINQSPGYWGIEPRFYLPAFWFVCAYAGYGFSQLTTLLADVAKILALKLAPKGPAR